MRALSFKGFLKQYLLALSDTNTLSITKLMRTAVNNNARLAEPLYLYAVLTGKRDRLVNASAGTVFNTQFTELSKIFRTEDSLLKALKNDDERLPSRFRKVYSSYLSRLNRYESDRAYSLRAREVILDNLKQAGVSNYRVYTDLGLNPGNINNYLKNADATKVSRETVNRMLDYTQKLIEKSTA